MFGLGLGTATLKGDDFSSDDEDNACCKKCAKDCGLNWDAAPHAQYDANGCFDECYNTLQQLGLNTKKGKWRTI